MYRFEILILGVLIYQATAQKQEENSVSSVPIINSKPTGTNTIVLTDSSPSYNIYSPNFPENDYPPNVEVYYNVEISMPDKAAEMGARILVTFEMFALQPSKYCTADGLEITQPNNQVSVFCASQSGQQFLSDGHTFEMRFFSDSSIEERGFSIKVEIYQSSCSKTFIGNSNGTISSPGFPRFYQSNELCVWKIVAPKGKKVRLGFNEVFNIQGNHPLCLNDFLKVSHAGDFVKDIVSFCGNQAPKPIISQGNELLVKFASDCCFHSRGFSASFSFVEQGKSFLKVIPTPEPVTPSNCACGVENVFETRIIGGAELSPPNKYPWMSGLHNEELGVFCGATLISKQYLLTAAHCVTKETPQTMKVLLGGFNLTNSPDLVGVDKIIINPNFSPKSFQNDIALVRLKSPVTFSNKISPVCLPPSSFDTNNRVGVITGWGKIKEAGDTSNTLLTADLNTITLAECKQKYGTVIFDTSMCAGGNKSDACQGDSGGPLTCKAENRNILMGVVSWGIGCGRSGYPGVFTRVSAYNPWIEEVTQDAPACESSQQKGPLKPNIKDCGQANHQIYSRVVGGYPTYSLEYPWLAIITVDGKYEAVGVLISPRYVLTARHWLYSFHADYLNAPERFTVVLGRYNLSNTESQAVEYQVTQVSPDPNFGTKVPFQYDHDFAILKLSKDVNTVFKPICLPRAYEKLVDGSPVYGIGWGQISTYGEYSKVVREVELKTISEKECASSYPYYLKPFTKVTSNMFCAGALNKGMCKGDGGAPLMAYYEGRYYLTGITSWGSEKGCAVEGQPDVFATVNKNLQWIAGVTGLEVGLTKPK